LARKPDEKFARKIKFRTLSKLLKGLLVLVGKPLYIVLSYSLVAILFATYLIGHSVRVFLLSLTSGIGSLPVFIYRYLATRAKLLNFKLELTPVRPSIATPSFKFYPRIVFSLLLALLLIFAFWYKIIRDLPSPGNLTSRNIEVSTKIYDRNGILLYKIYENKNRTIVPLDKIPQTVQLATLAAEDAEFYEHPGFSVKGIVRALSKDIRTGQINGGSTITQQLVKNALLSSEKTLTRKIKEIILSVEVELTYSKDQILEMYLNEVSYGGTAYGIAEASRQYFGKDVEKLNLAEAALLAGLPKSPSKYSPFGANPELAYGRQEDVLHLMRVNGYITSQQESEAREEKLVFVENKTEIKAPHFVMYVRDILADKYGEEAVAKGGLEVITTLDYSIQKMAEAVVSKEVESLKGYHVGNGAALVLNPRTGQILAMVGSKDYFDIQEGGNVNVTLRLRQPGSSIKVVNYAYALSHGYTPASILDDSPVSFSAAGQPPYSPKNYDGQFQGNITLRSALAQSRNVPAVKVLASYGVSKMLEQGKLMGITTWEDTSRYGLSLTLGGGDVKLLELARVYATIGNFGKRPDISPFVKITDYKGKVLEENRCLRETCENPVVLDPRVAYQLIDILKDNVARAPEFGLHSSLFIPKHPEVAAKTGTSNDLKDNLTLGFNQNYLVATWVGNNDSSPMAQIASGITGAAPIWNKIMQNLLAGESSKEWEVPSGLAHLPSCNSKLEWFLEEAVPKSICGPRTNVKQSQLIEPAPHFP
jgi:1A family penicillin-binding protein